MPEEEDFKGFFAAPAGRPKSAAAAHWTRQRWIVGRKREFVLRCLPGESLDGLSRELGVQNDRLEQWRDKAMAGFEALLRSKNRELGLVNPEESIPIAEDRGLITKIGSWYMHKAFQQIGS